MRVRIVAIAVVAGAAMLLGTAPVAAAERDECDKDDALLGLRLDGSGLDVTLLGIDVTLGTSEECQEPEPSPAAERTETPAPDAGTGEPAPEPDPSGAPAPEPRAGGGGDDSQTAVSGMSDPNRSGSERGAEPEPTSAAEDTASAPLARRGSSTGGVADDAGSGHSATATGRPLSPGASASAGTRPSTTGEAQAAGELHAVPSAGGGPAGEGGLPFGGWLAGAVVAFLVTAGITVATHRRFS